MGVSVKAAAKQGHLQVMARLIPPLHCSCLLAS